MLPTKAQKFIELSKQSEQKGRLTEALEYQLKAVDLLNNELELDNLLMAEAYFRLSKLLYTNGYLPKAVKFARHALEIRLKLLPENSLVLAETYNFLARLYLANYYTKDAMIEAQKSVKIYQKHPGNPGLSEAYLTLATALYTENNTQEAIDYAKKCLSIYHGKTVSQDLTLADCYLILANIYLDKNKIDLAKQYASKALQLYSSLHVSSSKISEAEDILKLSN